MKIDYERKALLLSNGLTKKVKKLDRDIYDAYLNYDTDKIRDLEFLFCVDNNVGLEVIDECRKINQSTWIRTKRCKHKIECILSYEESPVFLTLTFNDETLSSTNSQTRRKYLIRYLKSQSPVYVANIDYGGKHGREHYHAVVVGQVDYSAWHEYGSIKGEKIRNTDADIKRVSKYVSKLTNHAIKNTTKGNRVIYSR